MMVVDDCNGANYFFIQFPFSFHQPIPDQIPNEFGTVLITSFTEERLEMLQQLTIDTETESNQI
jgi:hypothetical protein